jgi:hypothetical protein
VALSLTRLLQWKLPSVTFDFFYCSQGNFPCSREPTDSYVQLVLVHFRIGIAHYSVSITRTKNSFQATPVDRGTASASDGSTVFNARSSTNSPSTPVHRRMYTAAGTLSITHSGVNSSVSARYVRALEENHCMAHQDFLFISLVERRSRPSGEESAVETDVTFEKVHMHLLWSLNNILPCLSTAGEKF